MADNLARVSGLKSIGPAEAKAKVLELIAAGAKVNEACRAVGRSPETYRDWRKNDPDFKQALFALRDAAGKVKAAGRKPVPDFPQFAEQYLQQPLGMHHLRMWDVIRGKEPRDMHPSMQYQKGRPDRVLLNIPPGFAKSITWTVNYPVWRIAKDQDVLITIVSKGRGLAEQFLGAIKHRLTSPMYQESHLQFAPEGGWKDPDGSWTGTRIFVKGRGSGEKDPTVQCLGFGSQIYGTRSNLIILDDIVDLSSANQLEKQLTWITQEADTRLKRDGMLLVLGTRVAPLDLYSALKDPEKFSDYNGDPVWTYLAQPAILEEPDRGDPKTWVTLWPETREHGERKPMWDGPSLAKKRATMRNERHWKLVYQQQDIGDDAVFPPGAVQCAIDGTRWHGELKAGAVGHPPDGMKGMFVVAGLDPATVGHTAMLVMAVDRRTQKRWVLDAHDQAGMTPHQIRERMKEFTVRYGIKKWVVERNAFQAYLTRDEELKQWLYARQCILQEHYTHGNKYDPDFGVASMAPLFLSCGTPQADGRGNWTRSPGGGLIGLPQTSKCTALRVLVDQLQVWQPEGLARSQLTDMVMALWFAEIGARKYLGIGGNHRATFAENAFLSRYDASRRKVIDLNELEAQLEQDSLLAA